MSARTEAGFIKAGVIGAPVSHSLSPLIHSWWIDYYGLSGSYQALEVAEGTLAEKLPALIADGFSGFNVTLPHKQTALGLCDELDSAARAIGAVNTIVVKGGIILGSNTDVLGFMANLRDQVPDYDPAQRPALVLGAGGAARAIVWGLKQAGVPEIRVSNRTQAKADLLANAFGATSWAWERRAEAGQDVGLVVNTTSLGMVGKKPLAFDLANLPQEAVVYDVVYNPLWTPLLKAARERGHPVVEGLGMLLHQARPGFQSWFGVNPIITEDLRGKCLAALAKRAPR